MFNFTQRLDEVIGTIPECVYIPGWGYAGDGHLDDGQGSSYLMPLLRLLSAMAGAKLEDVKTWDYKRIDKFLTEKKIDASKLFPIKGDDRGTFVTGYTPKIWVNADGKPVVLFGPKDADLETGLGPNTFEVTYRGKTDWSVGSLTGTVTSYEKGKEKVEIPKLDLVGEDGISTITSVSFMVKDNMTANSFKLAAASVVAGSETWESLLKPAPELGSGGDYSDSPILRDWQLVSGDYLLKKLYGPYQKEGSEWLGFMVGLEMGGVRYTASVPMNESNSSGSLRGKRPLDPASPLAAECRKQLTALNATQAKRGKFQASTLKKAAERLEVGEDVPTWLIIMAKLDMGCVYTYRVKDDLISAVKSGKSHHNEKGYPISPKIAILSVAPDEKYLGGVLDINSLGESVASGLTPYLPAGKDESPDSTEAMPF